jgi:hypothetical protein
LTCSFSICTRQSHLCRVPCCSAHVEGFTPKCRRHAPSRGKSWRDGGAYAGEGPLTRYEGAVLRTRSRHVARPLPWPRPLPCASYKVHRVPLFVVFFFKPLPCLFFCVFFFQFLPCFLS